jgi:hypothetical protein
LYPIVLKIGEAMQIQNEYGLFFQKNIKGLVLVPFFTKIKPCYSNDFED